MREYRERSPKRGLGLVLLALLLFFGVSDFSAEGVSVPGGLPSVAEDLVGDGGEGDAGGSGGNDAAGGEGSQGGDRAGDADSDPSKDRGPADALGAERNLDDPVFYVRSTLSKDDQKAYDLMYQALTQRTEVPLSFESPDDLARIRDCVLADHPEIFYTRGISYSGGSGSSYMVSGTYTHSEESARDSMDLIEMVAEECLSGLPSGSDDYEKAKYIYEYIIDSTTYGKELSDGQTIENVLIDKQAVCAGYASTFQYFMQRLGCPCIYVSGEAGERHAWCAVKLDGEWYLVDPTWGDPLYNSSESDGGRLSYSYLCVTDADLSATHTKLCTYEVPSCTATANNYFVREGQYFDAIDIARAGSLIGAALDGAEGRVEIRCATRDVYDGLKNALVDDGKIYDYMSANSYSYTTNEDMLILGFLKGE